MDPRVWPYILAGVWGFVGAVVYAVFRLRVSLLAGDVEPTRREKARAWAEFFSAPLTGVVLATGLTEPLAKMIPWLNFTGVALVIGLSGNHVLPLLLDIMGSAAKKRLGDALVAMGAALTSKKDDEA